MKRTDFERGQGHALRPITHTRAKQLIRWRTSRSCFSGSRPCGSRVKDIGIVVGDTADEVMAAAGTAGSSG